MLSAVMGWKKRTSSGMSWMSIPRGERVLLGADFNGHVGEANRG